MPDLPNDAQWLPRLPLGDPVMPFDEEDLPRHTGRPLPDGVRVVQAMPLPDDDGDEAPWT
jgi:hypothetical protein